MTNPNENPLARSQNDRAGHDQQSVLRAAMEVFSHHGYDAASMDDVAELLGISRPALYYHVPSKQELLRLAVEPILTALENIHSHPETAKESAGERLGRSLRQMLQAISEQLPSAALLLRLRGNTEMERAALQRRYAVEQKVSMLTSQAWKDGAIRRDVDPQIAARLLVGMIYSTADWYSPCDGLTPQQLADSMHRLGFHGMRSEVSGNE